MQNHPSPLRSYKALNVPQTSRPTPVEPCKSTSAVGFVGSNSPPLCPSSPCQPWQDSWYTGQAECLLVLSKVVEESCCNAHKLLITLPLQPLGPTISFAPPCTGVCDWCTLHSPSQHSYQQVGIRSYKWNMLIANYCDFTRLFPVITTSINNQGFFLSFVVCIMWHFNSLYTDSSSALIVCFCTVIN